MSEGRPFLGADPGPFQAHVRARQALIRTALRIAVQLFGDDETVLYGQLELDAAQLTEAVTARNAAIKSQDDRARFQPPEIQVVHVGDTDWGIGGEHHGGG